MRRDSGVSLSDGETIGDSTETFVDRLADFLDLSRDRAREILSTMWGDSDAWVRSELGPLDFQPLEGGPRVSGARCGVGQLRAGGEVPGHPFRGRAWVLALSGSAREDGGAVLTGGQVYLRSKDRPRIRTLGDEPFRFAVVSYAATD